MSPLDFIVLSLAAWRLAYFVVKEDGPFDAAKAVRARTTFGGLLTCIYCMSVWTAALVYVTWLVFPPLVWIFALSGGAMMFWRWTGGEHV